MATTTATAKASLAARSSGTRTSSETLRGVVASGAPVTNARAPAALLEHRRHQRRGRGRARVRRRRCPLADLRPSSPRCRRIRLSARPVAERASSTTEGPARRLLPDPRRGRQRRRDRTTCRKAGWSSCSQELSDQFDYCSSPERGHVPASRGLRATRTSILLIRGPGARPRTRSVQNHLFDDRGADLRPGRPLQTASERTTPSSDGSTALFSTIPVLDPVVARTSGLSRLALLPRPAPAVPRGPSGARSDRGAPQHRLGESDRPLERRRSRSCRPTRRRPCRASGSWPTCS